MTADDLTTTKYADEAEDTRERIAATIDELQERLDPRRIVGDAVGSVQASGNEIVERGLALAKAHPIAFAAAGLVLALIAVGGTRLKKARVDLGDIETYSDYDDDYNAYRDTEHFSLTRSPTGNRVADNPVLAIGVAVAAGALLATLLPATERERELFGETGDRLKSGVRSAAADMTDQARAAVQQAMGSPAA